MESARLMLTVAWHALCAQVVGHGVLDEMSITEMKERLARLKQVQREEQEELREQIVRRKQEKELLLLSKAARLATIRTQAERDAYERRVQACAAAPLASI
jgi:Rps23 Pro-64 3,4-dihydroxylase Tpa1-like proline 4-hydroxylase